LLKKAESLIRKEMRGFREKKSAKKRSKMSKKACTLSPSRTLNDVPQKRIQKIDC
jgi:hypothetical protein